MFVLQLKTGAPAANPFGDFTGLPVQVSAPTVDVQKLNPVQKLQYIAGQCIEAGNNLAGLAMNAQTPAGLPKNDMENRGIDLSSLKNRRNAELRNSALGHIDEALKAAGAIDKGQQLSAYLQSARKKLAEAFGEKGEMADASKLVWAGSLVVSAANLAGADLAMNYLQEENRAWSEGRNADAKQARLNAGALAMLLWKQIGSWTQDKEKVSIEAGPLSRMLARPSDDVVAAADRLTHGGLDIAGLLAFKYAVDEDSGLNLNATANNYQKKLERLEKIRAQLADLNNGENLDRRDDAARQASQELEKLMTVISGMIKAIRSGSVFKKKNDFDFALNLTANYLAMAEGALFGMLDRNKSGYVVADESEKDVFGRIGNAFDNMYNRPNYTDLENMFHTPSITLNAAVYGVKSGKLDESFVEDYFKWKAAFVRNCATQMYNSNKTAWEFQPEYSRTMQYYDDFLKAGTSVSNWESAKRIDEQVRRIEGAASTFYTKIENEGIRTSRLWIPMSLNTARTMDAWVETGMDVAVIGIEILSRNPNVRLAASAYWSAQGLDMYMKGQTFNAFVLGATVWGGKLAELARGPTFADRAL
ncbi:MAG TPA: hypothetical protein PLO51_02330, partial [Candidatus Micrarchaeota archaeon]|nr:hypothetical protein [Candidatus Micrarchaeota archaeon]